MGILRRGKKKTKAWKVGSGHRKRDKAIEERDRLRSVRKRQEFRVRKGTDQRYPWEVQYRNK